MPTRFDNKINTHKPDPNPPTIRKVPADSVPYGENISRNGKIVWVGLDDNERIICVAATADEARRKVKDIRRKAPGGIFNVAEDP